MAQCCVCFVLLFDLIYLKNLIIKLLFASAKSCLTYSLLPYQIPEGEKSEKVNPQGQVLGDLDGIPGVEPAK